MRFTVVIWFWQDVSSTKSASASSGLQVFSTVQDLCKRIFSHQLRHDLTFSENAQKVDNLDAIYEKEFSGIQKIIAALEGNQQKIEVARREKYGILNK